MNTFIDTRTEREELMDLMSDMSKDLYGFRMRYNFPEMTTEEMKAEYARLAADLEEEFELERAAQEDALESYEEEIESFMKSGAETRKQALLWMMQAEEFEMSGVYSEKECVVEFLMMNVGLGTMDINEEVKRLDLSNEINLGY